MSKQTLDALHEAINQHRLSLEEANPGAVLIDWVVGYCTMTGDEGFQYRYACSQTTPHGSLGLAQLTVQAIDDDLSSTADDDD